MNPERLQVLESLVDELLKDDPKEPDISKYMERAGIENSPDPIERIKKVLMALHFEETQKEIIE